MTNFSPEKNLIDHWIPATWEDYLKMTLDPRYQDAKFYYYQGKLRLEMVPQGYDHSADNFSMGYAIALFCALQNIPISGLTHCTFRKTEVQEAQPDLAFYLGEYAEVIPPETTLVNLDSYPPPTLVIEIAKTSLADDLTQKRQLYEHLQVSEYWVVNVKQGTLIAFQIFSGQSQQIEQSQVLSPLKFSLLETALQRSRSPGRGHVYTWLLTQMQSLIDSKN